MNHQPGLPPTFQFSQSSLQDYDTCPRRFQLRYLEQMRWPAIESEPVEEAERLARLGSDFHRLVQQHLVGLSAETLAGTVAHGEPDLQRWWHSYLAHRPAALDGADVYSELVLSAPLHGFRVQARFDALLRRPDGAFLIIDWKTAHHKPPREALERRLQTRVYPWVLAAAGAVLNHGQPINPAAISMSYWYPEFPGEPEEFAYSQKLFERDERSLGELIERVKDAAARSDFPLVEDDRPCRYCVYRSFCAREVAAGPVIEPGEAAESSLDVLALDWDQIAEIQF